MNPKIKISQLPAKGANLAGADLLEIAEFTGTGYVSKSITGQEIIDAAAGAGGVTDVTATAPIESTGGTTPDLSIRQSGSLDDGYLSSADWIAFNNKQDALTLTTTGTSGAATLVGSTLNIPQYSGGGGASGVHTPLNFNGFTSAFATSAAVNGTSIGNFTMQANQCIAYPYIPRFSFTANGFYLNVPVGVAGNLARILVYQDTNGVPTTKLFESANLDLSTSGVKTAATTFTFNAGTTYWLAFHCNAVPSGSISGISVANAINIAVLTITPITALTRTITFGTSSPSPMNPNQGVNSILPFIGITKA